MTSPIRRRLQRLAASIVTIAAVAGIALIASAGAAQSQQPIKMRTSVTTVGTNGRAIITAVVRFTLKPPVEGRVYFYDQTTHRSLGSGLLKTKSGGPCAPPARVCRTQISVSGRRLALGANRITGSFNPRLLYYPRFVGHTLLYRGVSPRCRELSPVSVGPVFTGGPIMFAPARRGSVCRGSVRDPQGGTSVSVTSMQRVTVEKNTVVAFGAQTLPCTTKHTGDLMAYSVSRRAPGDLALQVYGHAATVAHRAHPGGYLCYESTIPFRTASGARARLASDGYYYGSLPHCRNNDGDDIYPVHPNGDDARLHAAPCIEWEQYSVKHGQATWTTWFEPTVGDPKVSW
jgi:hypothetical protein